MNINYTKKSLGSINTVSATNTKININSNTTKLSGDYFQSKSSLKEAKETSIGKVEFVKQLNEYVIDPATAYNDIIDLKNGFTEEEWEEYYNELTPEAKAKVDYALKLEEVQNNIMNSDEEDIIDLKDGYSEEEWEEIYNNLSPEAQEKVKAAEEWKKNEDRPWYEKLWDNVGGFAVGVVSFPVRLVEKGVDLTVSVGATALSGASYLAQGMTGIDMQFARDAIEGGAKDFIAKDFTKDIRDNVLDSLGASEQFKQAADAGEGFANDISRAALKTASKVAPPPYKYIAMGALAADTYAEEIQTAYQNGASFGEGVVSAAGCATVDFAAQAIPGSSNLAAFGKSFGADTVKDVIRYASYEHRNTDAVSYFGEHLGKNTLNAGLSMVGGKLADGVPFPKASLKAPSAFATAAFDTGKDVIVDKSSADVSNSIVDNYFQ